MNTVAILSGYCCYLHPVLNLSKGDFHFHRDFLDVGGGYGRINTLLEKADFIIINFSEPNIERNSFSLNALPFVFLTKAIYFFKKPFVVCKSIKADQDINPLLGSMVSNKEISNVIEYTDFSDFTKKIRVELEKLHT